MKKVAAIICGSLVSIGILSNVVFARSSTSYSFRLPATGTRYTGNVIKLNCYKFTKPIFQKTIPYFV